MHLTCSTKGTTFSSNPSVLTTRDINNSLAPQKLHIMWLWPGSYMAWRNRTAGKKDGWDGWRSQQYSVEKRSQCAQLINLTGFQWLERTKGIFFFFFFLLLANCYRTAHFCSNLTQKNSNKEDFFKVYLLLTVSHFCLNHKCRSGSTQASKYMWWHTCNHICGFHCLCE